MTNDTELSILWAWLLALASGVLVYAAVRLHVARTIARWVGGLLANLFFGRQPGGRK